MQPCSCDSTNKSLRCGHYTKLLRTLHFWEHIFYHSLPSLTGRGYVHLFCSYLSKNEAVKLSLTLFMFYYNII